MIPGEYVLGNTPVSCNEGRETVEVTVTNTGDRPIQVGSHFHFFETNPALDFDRAAARGFHLDIPAGTAVRFEPGDAKTVRLVAMGGARRVYGFRNAVNGPLDDDDDAASAPAAGAASRGAGPATGTQQEESA